MAYFQYFRLENMIFENPTEKILSTAREIQQILSFRQKSAVPAIFRKFRLQKSVLLAMPNNAHVKSIIVLCEKKTKKY